MTSGEIQLFLATSASSEISFARRGIMMSRSRQPMHTGSETTQRATARNMRPVGEYNVYPRYVGQAHVSLAVMNVLPLPS
ncbi:hypothetical protein CLCR_07836 [Cladophialophora carrionii]|uniref:Uncharacterized protein n=1 Tax=Cladophialophora carrionii TaxID=86049 RepID=A0A1C1CM33_9EURO|nr:hypothetical protein CLCR_07836 [Cladophialophora carrionii]